MLDDIQLRLWNPKDLESLIRYGDNPAIWINMTDGFPKPFDEAAGIRFLERCAQHDPARVLAIDFKGEAIGAIGLYFLEDIFRLNAELGYWIAEPYQGKGIMTKALKLMCNYAFEHFELNRIFARPLGRNMASRRALEKAGFSLEYRIEKNLIKGGILEDEYCYSVRKETVKE